MPNFNIVKKTKPKKTFRVASIMGKFDLKDNYIEEKFIGNIDIEDKNWKIGVIVGSSGTGKTTIAKNLFKKDYIEKYKYSAESILDDFDKSFTVDDIVKTFNSVGFSSPPSWLKPYSVLSQGEKMRVDLARSIMEKKDLIVFDEFTSVVDRDVAKIGSAAISKTIKRTDKKFIAVSCHYDIIEWLEPDWVFDANEMKIKWSRGLLRRPKIEIKIFERKGMWNIFKKYHYLDNKLNKAARQFVAYIDNKPVGFCGILHFPHSKAKNIKKVTRLVVLPDYQGIGIGFKLLNYIGKYYKELNMRLRIVTSTPSLIYSFKNSSKWLLARKGRSPDSSKTGITEFTKTSSKKRYTTSWEYAEG